LLFAVESLLLKRLVNSIGCYWINEKCCLFVSSLLRAQVPPTWTSALRPCRGPVCWPRKRRVLEDVCKCMR